MWSFPYNVLDSIVAFSDRNGQIKLAQVDSEVQHIVYSYLYKKIMILDDNIQIDEENFPYTVVELRKVPYFAAGLNIANFQYVEQIVINTHHPESSFVLPILFHKLNELWNKTNHRISFVNYDVLSLRSVGSLNCFLEQSGIQIKTYEDEDCCITQKSDKSTFLRDWFMPNTVEFVKSTKSSALQRLSIYTENPSYHCSDQGSQSLHGLDFETPKANLSQISDLFLHSPLAYIDFMDMLEITDFPQLHLKRLCITSTHRLRHNAVLDFEKVIKRFNLNTLEELELKISCCSQHECQDTCMVNFFADWQRYNQCKEVQTKIKKLSIVHYKSLADTVQFKKIIEEFVFSLQFSELKELYLNLSNTIRSPEVDYCMDLKAIIDKMSLLSNLENLHISSFMSEWIPSLHSVFNERESSYRDLLINKCSCDTCNSTRRSFVKFAELDKEKNYSHKVKWTDLKNLSSESESIVNFNRKENVKFLQFVTGVMRNNEAIMENNITSSGTMLDMNNMPILKTPDVDPFVGLIKHSCFETLYCLMKCQLPLLSTVNFGGVILRN